MVSSPTSEAFVKAEWAQIVQAKVITEQRAYLKASRAGRGTPLDRRKRAVLWEVFSDYRARMLSEGLAEPDDAYREATEILSAEAPNLPYVAIIVDEAQDMGEQGFPPDPGDRAGDLVRGPELHLHRRGRASEDSARAGRACPPAGSMSVAGRGGSG